ncbi:hypothetical protein FJ949_15995 [Mesorhizobium sp. B2-4-1]|nr:hypothetical protein FJ426_01935 [Mesorhizobium sp. B2-6-4]TPL34928.1 hypothetical protein FJ947_15500 [Mesorhizobium sp. B2-4-8]TPL64766.1 hypothetical protein FJ949_15995 [Mesorhizobium sp. B2-4-1]TPN00211.1 hypothetical protein FJ966_07860 [Mesorhizobium sp. B2-1-5]
MKLPISPLVGEMAGRPEGGAVPLAYPGFYTAAKPEMNGMSVLSCRGASSKSMGTRKGTTAT